jgi:transposase
MFTRIKKSGPYQYLQIVHSYREGAKVKQRVIGTLGRLDELKENQGIDSLIRSLEKFSDDVLLLLTSKSQIDAKSVKIGPSMIFERLWKELHLPEIINELLEGRKYEFNVERVVFLTVLHRLLISGSDRSCERWKRDYQIIGAEEISLHHSYRAMAFLGDLIEDQYGRTPFTPRCNKDLIEEKLFSSRQDLFSTLELVFFDTTSVYFEGEGGETIGQLGNSKDNRPDLNQMVIGAVLDNAGNPICCELWPGNTTDVTTLLPIIDRMQKRFGVNKMCIVADRGMISSDTIKDLDKRGMTYILGARMRKVNEIRNKVLSRAGRYQEVYPESLYSKDPSPLKVKEVLENGKRYIVCVNEKQARKDEADRRLIIAGLEDKIRSGAKTLVGNKGYRKYVKLAKGSLTIDLDKVEKDARYDGKWVLQTNTLLKPEEVALKYKELWQVEQVFRDIKTILETRPVYHKADETIRGHVFCSFLALVLRNELEKRLKKQGYEFEWNDIKQDLEAIQEIRLNENGQSIAIRTQCQGISGKVFQAVGIALPPTIKKL